MRKAPDAEKIFYRLTHAQKRIFYDEKKYPGSPWANNLFVVRYKRELNFDLLAKAMNKAILLNDGLRLKIAPLDVEPGAQQYVTPYKKISPEVFDFSGPGGEQKFQEWVDNTGKVPFPLIDTDLFYFACLKFNPKECGYCMKIHHIISDGWTCFFLIKEINEMYEALEQGKNTNDEPNPSYIEYIADEQKYLEGEQSRKDREFWHNALVPVPGAAVLSPADNNPFDITAHRLILTVPDHVRSLMHEYCHTNRTSIYKVTLCALAVYLSRCSGTEDIVINGANHNRSTGLQEKMVGMFVSILPFRLHVDANLTFHEWVEKTGKQVNDIIKNHQKYPFDLLAAELREIPGTDIGFLRDITLVGHGDVNKENFEYYYHFPGFSPGPLVIHVNLSNKDKQGILELDWVYQVERFTGSLIRRFHQGLVNVLADALGHAGKKYGKLICWTR